MSLSDDQIRRLDEIGMIWNSRSDTTWEKGFAEAKQYYVENGTLDVAVAYITSAGYKLGKWIVEQRNAKRNGTLSEIRQSRLDSLGMIWSKAEDWDSRYSLANEYYKQHGNLNVPCGFTVNGFNLYNWIKDQKRNIYKKKLSSRQISLLTDIGLTIENKRNHLFENNWTKRFQEAIAYLDKYGNLNIPRDYIDGTGQLLYVWLFRQRKAWREGRLASDKAKLLREIGAQGFEP